ncbi:MAG: DUF433 domain-containing protein [Planctomycetaceae bacterium]
MAATLPAHVQLDERDVAWIDNTNVKVIEVALEKIAHGSSVEEICEQHRGYLSLAQIHAALTWYYDHQAEFDAEIARQLQDCNQHRDSTLDSPGRRRLRRMGKLG